MMTPELLAILQCPATGQALLIAPPDLIEQVRARLDGEAGKVTSVLITTDGKFAYPVRDGIPVLLSNEAIAM